MVFRRIKCGIEPYGLPFSIVSPPASGEHGMHRGVSVMKKAIFTAAAVFLSFVFLSCSDVFGGRETEGIAFTIPPLAPQSAASPARATAGLSGGQWSIYGFLFGEDADPEQIKNIANGQFIPPCADEAQSYKGLIQAVSLKGADISRPQPLFFQRIQAKTKCFVCVLVTYTTSARTEHTVFSGISPDSVLNYYGANLSFTDNFYTPDKGENDISVTLKKNESAPVYFATQNGVGVIDSYGQSTYSPQQSTPYKPTHFYGYNTGAAMETGALYAGKALRRNSVIILMDDIDTEIRISASDKGLDYSVDFDSIPGKRCMFKASDFFISDNKYLSFTDLCIAGTKTPAGSGNVEVSAGCELRLGGAVTLEDETKIQLEAGSSSPGQDGKIVITRPLADDVGDVIVRYQGSGATEEDLKKEAKAHVQTYPLLRDDSGANIHVSDVFGDEVKVEYASGVDRSFTARWKRLGGNSWALEPED